MAEITRALIARVGVDLAKNVIQVHAVDAAGRRVVRRAFKRELFVAWCVQLPQAVWWQWRRAQARTTSGESCAPWGWMRG